MHLHHLWLRSFRSYDEAEVALAPGLTVVVGPNGTGKSNLLEAAGYLSVLGSFRGAPTEALVRMGADRAVVRGESLVGDRRMLVEAELVLNGRNRVLLNKQTVGRTRDLREALRISVFSPEDLVLVKGGPAERRAWLDDLLVSMHPRNDGLLRDLDRVLRQRNALLKQAGGRMAPDVAITLDVWDDKLATIGTAVAEERVALLDRLVPFVAAAYADIADRPAPVGLRYVSGWLGAPEGLAGALAAGRSDDLRRGISLVGPHRDDVELRIEGRPSRTHASQGEQRTLALALRLAGHRLLAEVHGTPPVLLLDDVFSELDPVRSDALIRHLPPGQALLATAGFVPPAAAVEAVVQVRRPPEGATVLRPADRLDDLPGDEAGETVDTEARGIA